MVCAGLACNVVNNLTSSLFFHYSGVSNNTYLYVANKATIPRFWDKSGIFPKY